MSIYSARDVQAVSAGLGAREAIPIQGVLDQPLSAGATDLAVAQCFKTTSFRTAMKIIPSSQ